jgi:hypothetical protein
MNWRDADRMSVDCQPFVELLKPCGSNITARLERGGLLPRISRAPAFGATFRMVSVRSCGECMANLIRRSGISEISTEAESLGERGQVVASV